jgi:hypothetical protein
MSFKLTPHLITKIILWAAFWVVLAMLSAPLMADTSTGSRSSKSISYADSDATDKNSRDEQLKKKDADIMEPLVKQGFRPESSVMALHIENTSYNNTGDITLYDATTDLISDFNDDGFYHRFSVTIDADTIYDTAYVYARLYLSYEGGPWNHYATSDNYHIYRDSSQDAFTIETELADGFAPGYYDIRIELYDADYDEWLLNYGPYDDASLSALPLEDSYYDDSYQAVVYPVETEILVSGHGHGSMSWWLLVVPILITAVRRGCKRDKK